jgi:hypothetical protein
MLRRRMWWRSLVRLRGRRNGKKDDHRLDLFRTWDGVAIASLVRGLRDAGVG